MFISLKKHFISAKFFSFYIKKFPAFHIKCAGNSLYCFIIEKRLFFSLSIGRFPSQTPTRALCAYPARRHVH